MSRSKWKGPFVIQTLEKKEKNIYNVPVLPRNSEIIPVFVDKTFKIPNGRTHVELTITEDHIGHKLGEFVFTRSRFSFKKKKSKK